MKAPRLPLLFLLFIAIIGLGLIAIKVTLTRSAVQSRVTTIPVKATLSQEEVGLIAHPLTQTTSAPHPFSLTSTPTITITTTGFQPTILTTTTGVEVTWYNATDATQTVQTGQPHQTFLPTIFKNTIATNTATEQTDSPPTHLTPTNSDTFSANLLPGSIFTYTFNTTGTHPYFLATAPNLRGEIIVQPAPPAKPTLTLNATPISGTVPLAVTFVATPTDFAPGELIYEWSFGDGITQTITMSSISPVKANRIYPIVGLYTVTVSSSDSLASASANQVITVNEPVIDLPPDPTSLVPPMDNSLTTNLKEATEFLYTGSDPIQKGVAAGTIETQRAAVVRGRVQDSTGAPLPGVSITVQGRPEFGSTLTRKDGMFDLAVNGGGQLTVQFQKNGFLLAQRQVMAPWQNYIWLPDVILVELDAKVTSVDLSSDSLQVAQSSIISDTDGVRQQTLLFPPSIRAGMTLSNGTRQTLETLHVRATEYTVGEDGLEAMPDELPANSGYTYAVEFSADEALGANAVDVQFDQPVISYVENFLDASVGSNVPAGYYDRDKGEWIPAENGRVIKILNIADGLARLDTNGDGQVDNGAALGITPAERQQLATLYEPGQSLWRVPVRHFSPWDYNWPFGPPPDATYPGQPAPTGAEDPKNSCTVAGSIIECQNQVLGQALEVNGTPFTLHYQSNRVPGRKAAYTIDIPLSGATVPPSLARIELEIEVAGRRFTHTLTGNHPCLDQKAKLSAITTSSSQAPLPAASVNDLANQRYSFTWDGKDAYGRTLQSQQPVTVRIGYAYCGVYQKADKFGYNGGGLISGSLTREEVTLWQEWQTQMVGPWDARPQGLGGWTMNVHHVYDPGARILYLGDGTQRNATNVGGIITTLSQNVRPESVAVAADGSVYFPVLAAAGDRVYRLSPQGQLVSIAGTNGSGYNGDGIPATAAKLNQPGDVALGPDGSVYIAEWANNRIRRVGPDGIITTVAGNGGDGYSPDGTPATQAQLYRPQSIALGPDGSLYILHDKQVSKGTQYVRRVGQDGILTTAAGKIDPKPYTCSGEGGPATEAEFNQLFDIDAGQDGSLYIAASCDGRRVFRVTPDGIIRTVAGGGSCSPAPCGNGGLALDAALRLPTAVSVMPDGNFLVLDGASPHGSCVRQVKPDGIISRLAGNCSATGYSGDGGLAAGARLFPNDIASGPDGNLYIAESNNDRIRRVVPALPGLSTGDILVPAEDGSEVYVFNHAGRHLRTLDALTNAPLYQFSYDEAGQLTSITDGDKNVTKIERDTAGRPTAIVAPFGQRTELSLDANGYLSRVSNPISATTRFTYTGDGLLTAMTDAREGTYRYGYDSLGRLTQDADPAGGVQNLARVTTGHNYAVSRTTALSRTTVYGVDNLPNGAQRQVNTFPDGTQSQTQFNLNGSRTVGLPDGTVTTLVEKPDPRWGMQAPLVNGTVRTPDQLSANFATERTVTLANSNNPMSLTTLTDRFTINEKTYTSVYDAASRTFTDKTPVEGRQSTTTIDDQGRVVREQVAGLLPVSYAYDTNGRLIAATLGTGQNARTIKFAYNSQGYLEHVTDPLNRTTQFEYDAAGRVLTQTLPGARTILYAYDANDNLTAITPPGRPAHTFTYTPVDLAATYQPPQVGDGSSQTGYDYNLDRQLTRITRPDDKVIDFSYDGVGRLSTLTIPRGTVSYSYQPNTGLLANITAPDGISLAYGYDGALPTSVSWAGPISGTVGYTYDADFRLSALSINGGMTTAFQYDQDSLLTQAGDLTLNRNGQNGLLTGTTLGNVADAWTYNGFGEVTRYRATYAGIELFKTEYSYDKLGRIVTKTETISDTTAVYGYTYDVAGRLAEVKRNGLTIATYTYDSNGNRLSYTGPGGTMTGSYDDQDRLLQYGPTTYSYTANGELLSQTTDGETTTYNYDVVGNLISVTQPDGTVIEYLIDGQNRRVGKKVNGVLVQGFLYQDHLNPVAELDGSGNVVARFIYGSRINVPDYMVKGGVTYRIVSDHLGSPRIVIDTTTGKVVQKMDFDAYGSLIADTNIGFQPFGFSGGIYDQQVRLIRFGVRDYETEIGRWTRKDPILFLSDSVNLYSYASNNPVSRIDPEGAKVRFANNELRDAWYRGKEADFWIFDLMDRLERDPNVDLEVRRPRTVRDQDVSCRGGGAVNLSRITPNIVGDIYRMRAEIIVNQNWRTCLPHCDPNRSLSLERVVVHEAIELAIRRDFDRYLRQFSPRERRRIEHDWALLFEQGVPIPP